MMRQLWWFIDLSQMRSQHQTKQSRPNLAQIQEAHCQVCFISFDRAIPKRLQEGLQILYCSHCHITVHKGCYDFQPNVTILSQQVSQFLCERCKLSTNKQVHCMVCYGQQGALKPIGENQFIHVYCGLVHNDIDVISYYPTISFRKSLQYQELSNICEICMKRNAHEQCAEESCRKKVHTYCAKTTYVKLAAESDQPHSWNHHISHGNHGNFDLSEEIISYQLYSEEVEVLMKEINQAEIDLPMKQSLKRKIHKEYMDELRGKRKSTKKLRRGGFSYILCSQHESSVYCVCQNKEEGEMVLCECCFEWYHQKCINYNTDEPDQKYVCQFCKIFYEFKRKAIEEVKGGRADADINKIQLPLKFSVADCMWVIRVIDNRIRGGQASKMLKQLSKYPLKSSCLDLLIRQQNRNKLNALAQSFVQQLLDSSQIVSNLRPRPVLSLGNNGEAIVVKENVEYNLRLRKVVQVLVGLGIPAESVSGLQAEFDFKQRAVSDQYETIIELSKSTEPYQEVPILKQKAQSFNFIDIVQKIQQKITIPYQTLLDAYQKTLNNSHVPPYMLTIIGQKLTQIQPLIKQISATISENPENLQKITSVVQQLEEQHIQSPPQYLQLRNQRKFIQDLHLYYFKYNPSQIEEQKSIAEQIQLLLAWNNLKPSQQLVQIVNSYKPVTSTHIWKRTADLLKKCQSTVIEYELKQVLKRKVCKQDRLLQIMQNAASLDLQYHSEEVKSFVITFNNLKSKIDVSLVANLQTLQDYETISELLKATVTAIIGLDNFGIRIEEDGKNSLVSQLKTRQEELEQLQIIFTEAQLQKNPLTISKVLPSLPKNNPLVKQYNALKKQQAVLMNKFTTFLAKISQRIEMFKADSKKQRKEQIRQNNEKPSLSQTRELIQNFKQSQCDFSREIKELTRTLANTLDIANKVSRYCQQKHDFSNVRSLDELTNRRKQIDELRRRILTIAELSLKTQLTDLYHLEISLRMKNALLTPNLQQERIGFLLKVAEEQNLTHQKLYIELKDRFQTKNQKSKEVNQVKQLQSILNNQASRDSTSNYFSLFSYRRGLPLMDPADIKIKNSYVEQIVQKNKLLRHKISNILSGKTKLEYQEVKPIYLQALKNPFTIPELNKLGQQINKTWDIIRRWKENTNKWHSLSQSIFIDYQHSIFTIEEIEIVRRQLKKNEDEISHLKFMVESFSTQSLQQVEQVVQKIQLNPVIKDTPVCMVAELQYLQYWVKLLALSKSQKVSLSYQKLRKLILDAYNLLQRTLKRGEQYQEISPIIHELERYSSAVKNHLKQYPRFNAAHSIVDGFIDLEEFYFDNEEEPELADLVPLYKPFDDMPKFRVKNLQKIEIKREEPTFKRSHSKFEQVRGVSSDKNIQLSLSSQQIQEEGRDVPLTVSDNQRRKIKQIFLRNIKKNPELRKFGDCQNQVKMIQNQIFGEWHNDIVKYFEMSEQFEKLFIKLINCPNISNKIIKKKFQFKFINLLVGNLQKIDQLQNMVINKLKEQEAVKTITETVALPPPELSAEPALESINSVKFDQSAKEDLKKEMKLLKESRDAKESKHKKKKHHKHKDRSNSPDAKFSSDSEKELPKYIENEYNKQQEKVPVKLDPFTSRMTQSPLRYDPEQEQLQKKQTIFPRGSAIKLKTCEAQIHTKKRGKVEFSIDLYTDEQHRKVMELVDPGFTKLPIRKQKNQNDILPYINKSRKKYRFFVGWFQATNPLENELLRELAQQATQKKRVFGWQCEHIKLHMMSIKQLVTIPKMSLPSKVTTQEAADSLNDERMIFVLQYPERLYELKDQYKNFQNLECRIDLFNVNVPMPVIETKPINDYYHNYTVPTIQPLVKPIFKEPEVVYETWGEPAVLPTPPPPPPIQIQQQYGIHPRINQARMQYGFGNYSPILTDSEDNQQDKNEREDLADNLLNSLDNAKIIPAPPMPRDKIPNQPYQPQYYGGYNQYQAPPPQRPMPAENRWNTYQPMPQQPQHVYNPLNPMAPKYSTPINPMVANQPQMGQNQMSQGQMPQNPMSQGQMGQPNMMGMYKNPNQMMGQRSGQMNMGGHYYDPRYSGYQNPQ